MMKVGEVNKIDVKIRYIIGMDCRVVMPLVVLLASKIVYLAVRSMNHPRKLNSKGVNHSSSQSHQKPNWCAPLYLLLHMYVIDS